VNELQRSMGTVTVILKRLQRHSLPRLFRIKERVDSGDRISPDDMRFLRQSLLDALNAKPIYDGNPELAEISAKIITIYRDISSKALANEQEGSMHGG
jgi:hypothetical protein